MKELKPLFSLEDRLKTNYQLIIVMNIKWQWFLQEQGTSNTKIEYNILKRMIHNDFVAYFTNTLKEKLMGLFDFMTQDIAIDLGTANTLIIHNDKVVVDQPSIVAVDRKTEKVIAVGKRAQQMHGKSHEGIKTIRPLKDGVIADFGASEQMIRELVRTIPNLHYKFFSPSLRMVICILRNYASRRTCCKRFRRTN